MKSTQTSTKESPTPSPSKVLSLTVHNGTSSFTIATPQGARVVTLPVLPEEKKAQRLYAQGLSVQWVQIDATKHQAWCGLVNRRHPYTRRIPLGLALGLTIRKVPTLLHV